VTMGMTEEEAGGVAWCGVVWHGYKNLLNFLKFSENRWNRVGLNFKTVEFTVHCFKISKKKSAKNM
jgi:hypothetical protein